MAIRRCALCKRADAGDINRKLLDGVSYRRIIDEHEGLNLAALSRHNEHANEAEERDNEKRREIQRATAAGELTADTPPTIQEWERFVEDIAIELAPWKTTALKIADRLQRDGMVRYSVLFAALIPATMLHRAIQERAERAEFIPEHWLQERLPHHLRSKR